MSWRAIIRDDDYGRGVTVVWVSEDNGSRLVTNGDMVQVLAGNTATTDEFVPLRLRDDLARSLLTALNSFYEGGEDTRALRKDYDAERKRVDTLIAAVIQTADRRGYSEGDIGAKLRKRGSRP